MSYKQMCKNTAVEVAQQFNRKTYSNKPVWGKYKNNPYNPTVYVRLQGTYDRDVCIVINCNGLRWEGEWSSFHTTETPPKEYIDLYSEGYFQDNKYPLIK